MGWFFKKEAKETEETKDTNETNDKDDEFVSEFDRRYKVREDDPSQYKYHDTPEDPTKNAEKKPETGKKSDADDDDEPDPDHSRNGRNLDDDDDGR